MRNFFRSLLRLLGLAPIVPPDDPNLRRVADLELALLGSIWMKQAVPFIIRWGDISETRCGADTMVTINRKCRADDVAIRNHVSHEMFHVMTGCRVRDGEVFFEGKRIKDHVPWEEK